MQLDYWNPVGSIPLVGAPRWHLCQVGACALLLSFRLFQSLGIAYDYSETRLTLVEMALTFVTMIALGAAQAGAQNPPLVLVPGLTGSALEVGVPDLKWTLLV